MKLPRRHFLHLAAGAAALPVVWHIARAQAYPTRPVRLIKGFGAGSAPDIVARLIGQSLSERLGQSFVIENRSGAASNIATEAVVRAAPDGYTLLLITSANSKENPGGSSGPRVFLVRRQKSTQAMRYSPAGPSVQIPPTANLSGGSDA